MTRPYELLFVLNPEIGDEALEAETQKVTNLLSENGTVTETDVWGKRHLAYEIQKLNEGYYVLIHFSSDAEFPVELDRQLKINDRVIRHLITRVGE